MRSAVISLLLLVTLVSSALGAPTAPTSGEETSIRDRTTQLQDAEFLTKRRPGL